jgi:hypothetical protein
MKNALILLLFASSAALADDAAVLKCRTLPDAASRHPQAEVSRGLMGAYFLQVAGHTSAARVTRVQ